MMNTTEVTKATQTTEVTIKELVAAFKGKYANISPSDHYGISINMQKATLELEEDDCSELYLVSRDEENRVMASICIDEDSVESIEKYEDGTYTLNFSFCMTSIDISECKTGDKGLLLVGDLKSEEGDIIQIHKDEDMGEMYIDEISNNSTNVEEDGLIEVSDIGFVSED
ncbi:hypothetical protein AALB51_04515 [Lachnospiraceae bacterium 62-26]